MSLTPAQLRCFDELLAVGGPRPTTPPGIVDELTSRIADGTRSALDRWTERSLWVGKSQLAGIFRCESQVLADRLAPRATTLSSVVAVGQITHRAIQISHTHPGRTVDEYVRLAVAGCCTEEAFADFWDTAPEHIQSDCLVISTSRTVGFLDSFPPLDKSWTPRFEESVQVKIGRLTLAARPDLQLGRPRPDGRQTMLACDFKSGELHDEHLEEAHFYALVLALRTGCAPYRSMVYSLSSGEWTDPDVTAATLRSAAERVVLGVNRLVDVQLETRAPVEQPGRHCTWCPRKETCASHMQWAADGKPQTISAAELTRAISHAPLPEESVTVAQQPQVAVLSASTLVDGDDDPFAI